MTVDEYNLYKSRFEINNWSLKSEAIKYCELDCKALFEVVMNFGNKIFKEFSVNISTTPTLPSTAFKIYRTHFIPKEIEIASIDGKIFDDIYNAFYGGHVDMYIPANSEGTKVYGSDVNSLYPYAMKTYKYPYKYVGYFKGETLTMNEYNKLYQQNYVGFF